MNPPGKTPIPDRLTGMTARELSEYAIKAAYNEGVSNWEAWHEKLRVTLGAAPGDNLIEYAKQLATNEALWRQENIGNPVAMREEILVLRAEQKNYQHANSFLLKQIQQLSEMNENLRKDLDFSQQESDSWQFVASTHRETIRQLKQQVAYLESRGKQ